MEAARPSAPTWFPTKEKLLPVASATACIAAAAWSVPTAEAPNVRIDAGRLL
jgi:hypothetical protein